jgi:hypothetical protein
MRVVVPTAGPAPHLTAVEAALSRASADYLVIPLQGDDGYWRALRALWGEGEGFIVVEHDIVVWPGAMAELVACPRDWCQCPYSYGRAGGTIVGLGCTKFSTFLLDRYPDVMEEAWDPVPEMTDHRHPPGHWCRLDARLQRVLVDHGETPHFDHSEVEHLGGLYPAHDCFPR